MSPKGRYIIPLIDKHIPAYGEVMPITTHRVLSLLSGKLTDEGCAILANHKISKRGDADMCLRGFRVSPIWHRTHSANANESDG